MLPFETTTSDGSEAFFKNLHNLELLSFQFATKKLLNLVSASSLFFNDFFQKKKNIFQKQRKIASVCGVCVRVLAVVVVFAFRNVIK